MSRQWKYAGEAIPANDGSQVFRAIGRIFADLEGVRKDVAGLADDLGTTIARVDNQAAWLQQESAGSNAPVGVSIAAAMAAGALRTAQSVQQIPAPQIVTPSPSPHRSGSPSVSFQAPDVTILFLTGTDRAFRFRATFGLPFAGGEIARFNFSSAYQTPPVAQIQQTVSSGVGQLFPRESFPLSPIELGISCDPASTGIVEFSVIVVSPSESFD